MVYVLVYLPAKRETWKTKQFKSWAKALAAQKALPKDTQKSCIIRV